MARPLAKIVISAASGAALGAIVVASCLDRDDDAPLDRPGTTSITSADLPPGGASTSDNAGGIASPPPAASCDIADR